MLVATAIRPFFKTDCGLTEIAIDVGYEPQVWSRCEWCYVAFGANDKIVGYYTWRTHGNYVELDQFAVHKRHRRQGIGRDMMTRFVGQVSAWKLAKIVIPEEWLEGQLFLRATGWKCVSFVGGKMVFNRSLPE